MYKKKFLFSLKLSFKSLLVRYFDSHCNMKKKNRHCVKSVRIRGYCSPHFPANTVKS